MNPLIKSVSIINGFGGKVKRQNSRKMSTFAKAAAGDKKERSLQMQEAKIR
jgi:hypothetical protein